jgi:cyclic pyranopterin monophosphate synthase
MTGRLSHIDGDGQARMVDVSGKAETSRVAGASAVLRCSSDTIAMVRDGAAPKGAVISTAELAGVMAAKRTADLIPLCHPLPLNGITVAISIDEALPGFRIATTISCDARTGAEMEALTAASVAALTLFDMLKAVDKEMVIEAIRVTHKSGGKSGAWPGEADSA